MPTVDTKAPKGQDPVASALLSPPTEVANAWISSLIEVLDDLQAAVEDQQRPLRERRLGHLEAVRITGEGFTAIKKALTYAERGLAPPPTT